MKRLPVWAALALLLLSRTARAQEDARSTLLVGPRLSYFGSSRLEIDGERQEDESDPFGYGLGVGYRFSFVPWLGVQLSGGIGKYSTAWSRERDESRTRADLAVGLFVTGTVYRAESEKARRMRAISQVNWRLGLPVGVTWVWFTEEPSRLVDVRYTGGRGFTWAPVVGADLFSGRHGAYVELGVTVSSIAIQRTATLAADPSVGGDESYRYSDATLSLAWGYALRF